MTDFASLMFDFSPVLDSNIVQNADSIDFSSAKVTINKMYLTTSCLQEPLISYQNPYSSSGGANISMGGDI